jgi:signal transduction histidine kinase
MQNNIPLYEKFAIAYRLLGILLLYLNWIVASKEVAGLFLLLLLTIFILLRWRFERLAFTVLLDQIVILIFSSRFEIITYALALPAFDAVYLGRFYYMIPALISPVVFRNDSILNVFLLQSLFSGLALWSFKRQEEKHLRSLDSNQKRYYELESLKQELLTANVQVARMAEVSERSRIARELHDHAGHDIIAAYMSLQTAEEMLTDNEEEAKELITEAVNRLEKGVGRMRETIHNLAPFAMMGIESLHKLCEDFSFCSAEFKVYGNASVVPIHLWNILEPCLKEALTNIIRHSNASKVSVTLDITPKIIRLCVENNGTVLKKEGFKGLGLQNLRQRAGAVGGNISTDDKEGFRLVCVLPIS